MCKILKWLMYYSGHDKEKKENEKRRLGNQSKVQQSSSSNALIGLQDGREAERENHREKQEK